MESKLFSPVTFGPLTLRNRTIRSAAFESMCPENTPTQMLLDYHRSVAAGGVGMTTVAYAAVTQSGLSFDRQLWLRPSIIPRLHELTKGWKAPQCAGVIHTDFEKGFIRAEVIKYDDYIKYGSEAAVKEAGKLGVEGKEYVVQDGDIMHFRFNV